ncbi:hypothetical protein LCGC14_0447820 [marine sediment metagenome]|uniref:Uncharacterized protein n=1 Tax=marine sediment metagenome TaxID=412755 RepID=A0A0F9T1X8_9ZZZZ
MKKYRLDLSTYDVIVQVPVTKTVDGKEVRELESKKEPYPLRGNISIWLRGVGIFKTGEDIAEAVSVAKQIRDCKEDSIELDEREAGVVKQALNRLVELTAEGKVSPGLGGEVHEEAIVRVVKMEEVK